MIVVHVPAPLRPLTGGRSNVEVDAATLGEMVDALEILHPGLRARLTDTDRIRTGFAVFVNSNQVSGLLSTRLPESAEIYLAPAISGGSFEAIPSNARNFAVPAISCVISPSRRCLQHVISPSQRYLQHVISPSRRCL